MVEDVLVIGGGHNGLVAAILAAQAGRRVTLLERSDHVGGASVGSAVFSGHDVRLSRYSYLVSLMPDELIARAGIDLRLLSRTVSSFTPVHRGGVATGLLVERIPGPATAESFREVTGSDEDFVAWQQLYGELAAMAAVLAPMLTGRLRRRSEFADAVVDAAGSQLWTDLFEAPIGEMIARRFHDDTVRGVVATDALIGTHASLFGESLLANRCFLYHLIGRGTGEWLVPVGGMGALADSLEWRARSLGVDIQCGRDVESVREDGATVTVDIRTAGGDRQLAAGTVLAAVAPAVVQRWLGRPAAPVVGAQMKINMLLDRLPALVCGTDPTVAFAGTTHLGEGFDALEAAFRASSDGAIPDPMPSEVYCHSLADPSIMGGRPGHTLTLFGLQAPVDLFRADPAGTRQLAAEAALASLQARLAESLDDCLARDADGALCLDVASPVDVESSVGMPGGNIFHGDLSWPWLADEEDADTPARRFGVGIDGCDRILLAGAGTRRGGGVSGLGGLAAVDAMLANH